jgi:hypothetical protein
MVNAVFDSIHSCIIHSYNKQPTNAHKALKAFIAQDNSHILAPSSGYLKCKGVKAAAQLSWYYSDIMFKKKW